MMPVKHSPSRQGRKQTRASLASLNWSAGLRSVYDTTCGGTTFVFVAFALALGVRKEHMGFLTSIISLACILQILSLALTNVVRNQKAFVLALALTEPCVLIGTVLCLPFLPPGLRIGALGLAVALAAGSLHLTRPLLDNWVASTIPAGIRGRYLGRRFQAISVFTIISTLAVGFVVERLDKSSPFALGMVLAVGGMFGILSVFALGKAAMPAVSAAARVCRNDVKQAFHVRPFRRYLLGMLIYHLPFMLACPYYQVFNLRILEMRAGLIAAMSVGYYVVRILSMRVAGRLLDRRGARWLVLACGPVYVLFFLTFPFAGSGRAWPVLVAWAVVGAADAAFGLAAAAALYSAAPETPARPTYFALNNLITIGLFGIGALIAVPLLELLREVSFTVGSFTIGQFHIFYGFCGLLMIPALFGGLLFPGHARRPCS